MTQAMTNSIITREEEERLRTFRIRLALEKNEADPSSLAARNQDN